MVRLTDELRDWIAEHWSNIDCEPLAIADRIDEHAKDRIELFRDRDGEPIRFGDKMLFMRTFNVDAMGVGDDGTQYVYSFDGDWHDGVRVRRFEAKRMTHDHGPTVESLLRQMATDIMTVRIDPKPSDLGEIISEYASKLKLEGNE